MRLTMRHELSKYRSHDPRIQYRGTNPSRLDNLTDAVFGIAITLLIFNLANPNSFADLLNFTKTLPAFMVSITFLFLIWSEHTKFSEIYQVMDIRFVSLNTVFLALVIFYVYPLRFLTLFLTNFFFDADIAVRIEGNQVPLLMIYYGFIAFALYLVVFMFYYVAGKMQGELKLNEFEVLYTRYQQRRLIIMFTVPLLSIAVTVVLGAFSDMLASVAGGITYTLYTPLMILWNRSYEKMSKSMRN